MSSNDKKSAFLGMPFGTAANRLRKKVLFNLLCKYNENICFKCDAPIETVDELSLEHKLPWENVSVELYWDVDNIAFSHLKCNRPETYRNGRPNQLVHGTKNAYSFHKCRCADCRKAQADYMKGWRNNMPV